MQAMSVLHITQLENISQQKYVSWDKGGGSKPMANHVLAEEPVTRNVTLQNSKPFEMSRRSNPVNFSFSNFTLYL